MLNFLLRRFATMVLTALCLSFVVFYLTNLTPNHEKLAKSQAGARISDAEVESWLDKNGYGQPLLSRYGEWLGVLPGWTREVDSEIRGRCIGPGACAECCRATGAIPPCSTSRPAASSREVWA